MYPVKKVIYGNCCLKVSFNFYKRNFCETYFQHIFLENASINFVLSLN